MITQSPPTGVNDWYTSRIPSNEVSMLAVTLSPTFMQPVAPHLSSSLAGVPSSGIYLSHTCKGVIQQGCSGDGYAWIQ